MQHDIVKFLLFPGNSITQYRSIARQYAYFYRLLQKHPAAAKLPIKDNFTFDDYRYVKEACSLICLINTDFSFAYIFVTKSCLFLYNKKNVKPACMTVKNTECILVWKLLMMKCFAFRWAVSTVMTRQNLIPGKDGEKQTFGLIPLWDMCNHSNGIVSSSFSVHAAISIFSFASFKNCD